MKQLSVVLALLTLGAVYVLMRSGLWVAVLAFILWRVFRRHTRRARA